MTFGRSVLCGNYGRLAILAVLGMWVLGTPGSFQAGEKGAEPNLPRALALVPGDSFGFIHLRVADLWNSEPIAKLRAQFPEAAVMTKALPISPAEIESISIVLPSPESLAIFAELGMSKAKVDARPDVLKKEEMKKDSIPDEKPKKEPVPDKENFSNPGSLQTEGSQAKEDRMLRIAVIVSMIKPCDKAKVSAFASNAASRMTLHFVDDRTFVLATPAGWMKQIIDRSTQARMQGPQAAAIDLAMKKHIMVVGLNVNGFLTAEIKENALREMRSPVRSRPGDYFPKWALIPLLELRSAALSVDLDKESRVHVRGNLQFHDPEQAAEGLAAVQDLLAVIRVLGLGQFIQEARNHAAEEKNPQDIVLMALALKRVENALRTARIDRRQATVQIEAQAQFDVDALRAEAKAATESLLKSESDGPSPSKQKVVNNLKQIMLAMLNYHAAQNHLPLSAICSEEGKPLLSWRVALLPYLEEGELYSKFKLNESWDSPHNINLLPLMPKVFAPSGKEPHTTHFQVFVGEGTVFEPTPKKIRLTDISDGTSNTIGVVESTVPVPWTKPGDIEYNAKKPQPKLGGLFKDGFHAALMDGSVRFITPVVTEKTLRNAITRNDGEPLGVDW